jgi:hypothetical protein
MRLVVGKAKGARRQREALAAETPKARPACRDPGFRRGRSGQDRRAGFARNLASFSNPKADSAAPPPAAFPKFAQIAPTI